jgi:hypothetical protein
MKCFLLVKFEKNWYLYTILHIYRLLGAIMQTDITFLINEYGSISLKCLNKILSNVQFFVDLDPYFRFRSYLSNRCNHQERHQLYNGRLISSCITDRIFP